MIALPLILAFGGLVQYALTAGRGLDANRGDPVDASGALAMDRAGGC